MKKKSVRFRLSRRQHGYAVAIAIGLLLAVMLLIPTSLGVLQTRHNQAMLNRYHVQTSAVSRTTFRDLRDAVKVFLQKIAMAFQVVANQSNGKTGSITIDDADRICRQAFPKYFPLEMRGSDLQPTMEGAETSPDYGQFRHLLGRATVIVEYVGIRPAREVGLPEDTTGKRNNWAIQLRVTVPYSIQMFLYDEIPSDGNGYGILGSAWRPAVAISTWSGTKNKAAGRSGGSILTSVPRYDQTGQMFVYIALATPKEEPPPDLTDSGLTSPCLGTGAQQVCIAQNSETQECTRFGVQDPCVGFYNVTCEDPAICEAIANTINNNRDRLGETLAGLGGKIMILPIAFPVRTGQESIDGTPVFTPPRDSLWGKMIPPGIDGTVIGGGGKAPKSIAAGSNLQDGMIKFSQMTLVPGRFQVD